jgi:hypothetical protein
MSNNEGRRMASRRAWPPGTRTAVDIAGLFDQTEVKRRRAWQMEKAAFNNGFG